VWIKTAVQTGMHSIAPIAEAKGIKLGLALSSGAEHVIADEQRLIQILVNLLGNAAKFTESGGTVCVTSTAVAERLGEPVLSGAEPNYVRITVSDTGAGIAAEDQEAIFDKFRQAADKARGNCVGTGLGLAICRQLVEKMGGRIWVESQPGKGSQFHFTLPIASSPESETSVADAEREQHLTAGERS
jgi:two-component system CheB/CheR fusion protein